jgi:hypothetical protein
MLEFEPIQKLLEDTKAKISISPKIFDETKGFIENARVYLEDFLDNRENKVRKEINTM